MVMNREIQIFDQKYFYDIFDMVILRNVIDCLQILRNTH